MAPTTFARVGVGGSTKDASRARNQNVCRMFANTAAPLQPM
ncbi:hypothetical protein I542_0114 [Mycobacteroides abscessus 1948]|uniref:Uncharacterized protein n=1 Tax=Mycobacteroides abscessus 1948 TaxID=1299323 RepID=A0A829QBZ7_9MYCO|nr:hypothetical protein MA6G0125S_1552 [Mycobacteroides abscessus 6G-0125-S]EIU64495.1 hypothetical protein MA6G1108_1541 [Mycobacteroides abscessus 6G-1108]ETZ65049.1 hypothetical protein L836_1238 [Mycobacteroides abscessus MAB_110811_2726]EUA59990.1 hypothetical protein I542_0114 [Mycobacteroides abscessus 1948]